MKGDNSKPTIMSLFISQVLCYPRPYPNNFNRRTCTFNYLLTADIGTDASNIFIQTR